MKNMSTLQMIAAQALYDKYGFCPAFEQVKILESFNNEEYMLFRVREHEYRLDNGELINIEEEKKHDVEINTYLEINKLQQTKIGELKVKLCWQERKTKLSEIEKGTLAEKIEELKKTLHYRELALDQAAMKLDEFQKRIYQCDKEPAEE